MELIRPLIVALDSSTLGKVSRDYWSASPEDRLKARTFIADLRNRGVYVAFTLMQVCELLRHGDPVVTRERLGFLSSLPLIAWLRPYSKTWFPGSVCDLHVRELHAFHFDSAKTWREIIEAVRQDLWETGMGSEMFMNTDEFWGEIKRISVELHRVEKNVASIAKPDASNANHRTIEQSRNTEKRSNESRGAFFPKYAESLRHKLVQHGDRRLEDVDRIACGFAKSIQIRVESNNGFGDDPIGGIMDHFGVPKELVTPRTTLGEVGHIAAYVARLRVYSKYLRPTCSLSMTDVPIDSLPSDVLHVRLASIQQRADRVSGSDMGDAGLATLALYSDCIEVDKRTWEYLNQLKRSDPAIGLLIGSYFKESDYSRIPDLIQRIG